MRVCKRRQRRDTITEDHIYELCHGCWWPFMGPSWNHRDLKGAALDTALAEMKEAYLDHQEEVEAMHVEWCGDSWSKSWGWWRFASPEPRNKQVEYVQLFHMGLLDKETARAEAESSWKSEANSTPWLADWFRRPESWWVLLSTEPRDESVCEVAQLVRTKQLTPWEQQVIDGDFTDLYRRYSGAKGRVSPQWTEDELRLLGLTR